MIVLDYLLNPAELNKLKNIDIKTVTSTQLDYYFFCGSIVFRVDSACLDALWDWIPILDFAIKINEVVAELLPGKAGVLEFTESEDTIQFRQQAANVVIEASYAPDKATTSIRELRAAARELLVRLKEDLLERYPALAENANFVERLSQFGLEP